MARDLTAAYRAYLAELDHEAQQTLGMLSIGMCLLALAHPLLLLLVLPITAAAWLVLYRECRIEFSKVLMRRDILKRALRFDDYDPDLAESIEPGVHEGVLRLKHSQLENFWRSFEASCRLLGRPALPGFRHIVWMVLPLVFLTVGLMVLEPLRHRWNWLPVRDLIDPDYWFGILQVLAWLLGIAAATLGKYVIQMALVNSSWQAVVNLPLDEGEAAADGTGGARDEIITWHMPGEGGGLAQRNGSQL